MDVLFFTFVVVHTHYHQYHVDTLYHSVNNTIQSLLVELLVASTTAPTIIMNFIPSSMCDNIYFNPLCCPSRIFLLPNPSSST